LIYWLFSAAAITRAVKKWDFTPSDSRIEDDKISPADESITVESSPKVKGVDYYQLTQTIMELAEQSGYQVKKFTELLDEDPRDKKIESDEKDDTST
jgi:hypothetical protein